MKPLKATDAILLVRKNLDEQGINDTYLVGDKDSSELESIIAKTLPEAINAVHLAVPATMLEETGHMAADKRNLVTDASLCGTILYFAPKIDNKYLRLIKFKAKDSSVVLSESVPEVSPDGRIQLNKYLRGTSSRPVLVLGSGTTTTPRFAYYSLSKATADPKVTSGNNTYCPYIDYFDYVESAEYDATKTLENQKYDISENLRQVIIDQLTAMVLAIYNNNQAQYFFGRTGLYKSSGE